MITFEQKGKENTSKTLQIALEEAKKRQTDIIIATSSGTTAKQLAVLAKESNYSGKIVAVTLAYGFSQPGKNPMDEDMRKELTHLGVHLVTAAHALSGGERSFSRKHSGISTVEIVAETLRMFSQGVKVCVEIAVMANDAGMIDYGKPIICVAGSGKGADTISLITPAYTANILETKIHEIIAKPFVG